jgi:hypothetical protein
LVVWLVVFLLLCCVAWRAWWYILHQGERTAHTRSRPGAHKTHRLKLCTRPTEMTGRPGTATTRPPAATGGPTAPAQSGRAPCFVCLSPRWRACVLRVRCVHADAAAHACACVCASRRCVALRAAWLRTTTCCPGCADWVWLQLGQWRREGSCCAPTQARTHKTLSRKRTVHTRARALQKN